MNDTHHGKLGPFLATLVVASTMIGSGIFLLPASLGSVGSISIVSWFAATFGALLIGGVFCWLVVVSPGTTGLFSFIREALGPSAGFVAGALYWASVLTGCAAVSLAVAGYLSFFIPLLKEPQSRTIAAAGAIWLFVAANVLGPRFIAKMQTVSLGLGLAPVLLAALGGWFFFHGATFAQSWNVTGESDFSVVPRTTTLVFFAFLGIESAIILSVRVKNPARDVTIGTLAGLALAAAIYISASAVIMGILPAATLAKSSAPFADVTVPVLGALASGAVALCAMIKASGTLGQVVLITAETAECDSVLGQVRMRSTESKGRASNANLVVTGVLASLVVLASKSPTLANQFTMISGVSVVLNVLVYVAASLSLLRLSASVGARRRLWARVTGVCAALFCVALLLASSEKQVLLLAACAILVALAIYHGVRLRRVGVAGAA